MGFFTSGWATRRVGKGEKYTHRDKDTQLGIWGRTASRQSPLKTRIIVKRQTPGATKVGTESKAEPITIPITVETQATKLTQPTQQRHRLARRSRSIFTSPLGLREEAATARQYLLGQ